MRAAPAGEVALAFLILAHKLPQQVLRLVRALATNARAPIVVHVDRKHPATLASLRNAPNPPEQLRIISTTSVHWGHISTVDALLRGLEHILDSFPAVTHVKHLSGQDYPVRPLREVEALLRTHRGTSFLECKPLPNRIWAEGGEAGGGLNRIRFPHVRVGSRMVRVPIRRLRLPYELWGGSALWCLHREHASHVLDEAPRLRRAFRWTASPDELFFQTALRNSPFAGRVVDNGMTYVTWEHATAHPKVLRRGDLGAIHGSGCPFARKFDATVDAVVLDELDRFLGV